MAGLIAFPSNRFPYGWRQCSAFVLVVSIGHFVAREARTRRAGRSKNARTKRADDFARHIMAFGQDPAKTMMEIQAPPIEVLIACREPRTVASGVAVVSAAPEDIR